MEGRSEGRHKEEQVRSEGNNEQRETKPGEAFDGKKIIIQKEIKEEDLDELKSIGRVKRIYWEGNKGGS